MQIQIKSRTILIKRSFINLNILVIKLDVALVKIKLINIRKTLT